MNDPTSYFIPDEVAIAQIMYPGTIVEVGLQLPLNDAAASAKCLTGAVTR